MNGTDRERSDLHFPQEVLTMLVIQAILTYVPVFAWNLYENKERLAFGNLGIFATCHTAAYLNATN